MKDLIFKNVSFSYEGRHLGVSREEVERRVDEIAARDLSMSPSFEQITRMPGGAFAGRRRLDGLLLHSGMGW